MKGIVTKIGSKSGETNNKKWMMRFLTVNTIVYSTFGSLPEGLAEGDEVEFDCEQKGEYWNVKGEVKLVKKGTGTEPSIVKGKPDFRTPEQMMRGQALECTIETMRHFKPADNINTVIRVTVEEYYRWLSTGKWECDNTEEVK